MKVPGDVFSKPSVLVIDDDEVYGRTLSRGLREEGFAAIAIRSGSEALQGVCEDPPDAAVVDLHLDDDDVPGFLVIKAFRTRFPWIPVTTITGYYFESKVSEEVRALGVADHLYKPFELWQLAASLRETLATLAAPASGSRVASAELRLPSAVPQPPGGERELTRCESAFIDVQQRRLERRLRHDYPKADAHIISDACATALEEFVRRLKVGRWPRAPFEWHLYQSAWRNMRDALRSFLRQRSTETKYAAHVPQVLAPDVIVELAIEAAKKALTNTSAEGKALDLWTDGAGLREMGQVLCPQASATEQVREAKRFKDRVKARARRRPELFGGTSRPG